MISKLAHKRVGILFYNPQWEKAFGPIEWKNLLSFLLTSSLTLFRYCTFHYTEYLVMLVAKAT